MCSCTNEVQKWKTRRRGFPFSLYKINRLIYFAAYRDTEVPVLPAIPSLAFSSRVMRAVRPGLDSANFTAAWTLGSMEPGANCPSASYCRASAEDRRVPGGDVPLPGFGGDGDVVPLVGDALVLEEPGDVRALRPGPEAPVQHHVTARGGDLRRLLPQIPLDVRGYGVVPVPQGLVEEAALHLVAGEEHGPLPFPQPVAVGGFPAADLPAQQHDFCHVHAPFSFPG